MQTFLRTLGLNIIFVLLNYVAQWSMLRKTLSLSLPQQPCLTLHLIPTSNPMHYCKLSPTDEHCSKTRRLILNYPTHIFLSFWWQFKWGLELLTSMFQLPCLVHGWKEHTFQSNENYSIISRSSSSSNNSNKLFVASTCISKLCVHRFRWGCFGVLFLFL